MLILVAVTISMAVNGGLFDYAGKAAKETESEINKEKKLADLQSGLSLDELVAKYTGGWYENENGEFTNGKYTVEIGDYINYSCYNGENYSAESGSFKVTSSSNDLKWQVLGVENGNLLIVSEDSLGNLNLIGADGYSNGVSRLNTICAIYGHGQNAVGARSIKIEDVDKITGYDPMHDLAFDGNPFGYGSVNQYKNGPVTYKKTANNITYTFGNNQTGTYGNSSTSLKNVGARENSITLTIPESTCYGYDSSIISNDTKKFELLFGAIAPGNGKVYWLASPCIGTSDGYVEWGLQKVWSYWVSFDQVWRSWGADVSSTNGVRAVVSLASDIKLKPATAANTWDFDTSAE